MLFRLIDLLGGRGLFDGLNVLTNVQELRLGLLRVLNRLRAWINRSRLGLNLRAQYDLAEVSGSVFY